MPARCSDPRVCGVVLIAAHFFVEDLNIASIAAIKEHYEQGDLRARLARYHRDVDVAFRGWNDAWLDPRFRAFDITGRWRGSACRCWRCRARTIRMARTSNCDVLERAARCPVETRLIEGARHSPHLEAHGGNAGGDRADSSRERADGKRRHEAHRLPDRSEPLSPLAAGVRRAGGDLIMDVDPDGGLFEGCELKLNSYDLGVDIELADAVQRLRFEHPEVRCVVLRSGKEGVFCAGANIRMLGKASHGHKVNFCKFTNETRLAIEDASDNSGQHYLAAVSGSAAGGGYELAMAADTSC